MNKTILYAIIVLVIIVIVVALWYSFGLSSAGQYTGYRWKCEDTRTYTCPGDTWFANCYPEGSLHCISYANVTTSYSCPSGYYSSCSGDTLTCTYTWYTCSWSNPGDCTQYGRCGGSGRGRKK